MFACLITALLQARKLTLGLFSASVKPALWSLRALGTIVRVISLSTALVFHHFARTPLRAIYRNKDVYTTQNRFPSKAICDLVDLAASSLWRDLLLKHSVSFTLETVLLLECHQWSAAPISACLRRAPRGCFRGERCTGSEQRANY